MSSLPPASTFEVQVSLEGKPLSRSERGLVISCPTTITDAGGITVRAGQLDPDELRFSLLFWDCLDWPSNNVIRVASFGDAAFLESAGVLRRSSAGFVGGGGGGELLQAMHVGAFQAHEEKEPGLWSLGRGKNSVSFPETSLEPGRGLLFKLHSAIPVPRKDVPLADVLDFKRRREPELLKLRHHLEEIYQRIVGAPDKPLAEMTEFAKLDGALADHAKVSREMNWPVRFSGFEAKLNASTLTTGGAVLVGMTGYGFPLVQALAAAAGAFAAAAVSTGVRLRGGRQSATPFEYVTEMDDEL